MDVPEPDNGSGAALLLMKRARLAIVVGALTVLCVLVLRPFLAPILWAVILACVTWPLYRRLRAPFRKFNNTAATIVPLLWLFVLIQHELVDA
jgi:predicted PurR-regulated permease PerM